MVPAGNKAKLLSSVNHTTKTIHQFIITMLMVMVEIIIITVLMDCFVTRLSDE